MFLTITVDTHQKRKGVIKMNKSKFHPKKGWRESFKKKETGMLQKIRVWKRSVSVPRYTIEKQGSMF